MIRVLFLPAYFSPEHAASSYLGDNRYEKMAEEGMEMELYCPTPTRGISYEVRKKYKKIRKESMYKGKLHVHRFPLYGEGKVTILRAFRYFFQTFIHFFFGVFGKDARKCNVLFISSTPPIQGAMGAIVKKFRKIPLIYNLQDIFPDSLVNNGLAKKDSFLWKVGRILENFTYKNADKIIVISEDFKKNIIAKGVPEEKIVVIYNWVDQNAVIDISREKNKLFDIYGLDRSKFYVTYNGNIGMSQNMDMLLEVAESFLPIKEIQFVLVGNGAYLDQVKNIIIRKELENVHLIPFQPYEDISHVFSLGDISLVISKPGTGSASVPSKTWSIMSASRAVLANFDENELKSIINDYKCGLFTKAGDIKAFKDAILHLYENRELCKEYGKNGRQFVMDNLTRDVGTQKYVEVIKSVVGK